MLFRKLSAVIGILLTLLTLLGTSTTAHAVETTNPPTAPDTICDFFPLCPSTR